MDKLSGKSTRLIIQGSSVQAPQEWHTYSVIIDAGHDAKSGSVVHHTGSFEESVACRMKRLVSVLVVPVRFLCLFYKNNRFMLVFES